MNLRSALQVKARREEGFTLVELLVVIVILGVLSAVVVFSVSGITDNSEASACAADAKAIEVGIEAYRATQSNYPANLSALVPDFIRALPDVEGPGTVAGTFVVNSSTGDQMVYTPATGALTNSCP